MGWTLLADWERERCSLVIERDQPYYHTVHVPAQIMIAVAWLAVRPAAAVNSENLYSQGAERLFNLLQSQ